MPASTRIRDRRLLAGVLVFAATLLFLYVSAHREMSYVDELQHFDYLEKISRWDLVDRGETVGREALREMVCRGIDVDQSEYMRFFGQDYDLPPCNAVELDPQRFPEEGVNHASVHPPAYYFLTGIVARFIRAVTPVGSLLTAARIANAMWLIAAMGFVWLLLRELAVDARVRALICVVLGSSPPIVQTIGAVGPDAAALALGGAVVLSVMRWERGALPISIPIAACFASVAVKETNAVAVGLAVIYLAFRGYTERRRLAQSLRLAGLICVAVVAAGLPWLITQARFADLPTRSIPMVERFQAEALSTDHVVSELDALVTPVRNVLPPRDLRSGATVAATDLLHWLLLGGAFAAAVAGESTRTRSLGGASLAAMVLAGPTLVVVNYVLLGIYVVIPQRYGLSLLPALLAGLAVMTRRRWLEMVLASVAALGTIAVLRSVVG